jgi:hypothetical protein
MTSSVWRESSRADLSLKVTKARDNEGVVVSLVALARNRMVAAWQHVSPFLKSRLSPFPSGQVLSQTKSYIATTIHFPFGKYAGLKVCLLVVAKQGVLLSSDNSALTAPKLRSDKLRTAKSATFPREDKKGSVRLLLLPLYAHVHQLLS